MKKKIMIKKGKGKKAESVEADCYVSGNSIVADVGGKEVVLCTAEGDCLALGHKKIPRIEQMFADLEKHFPDLIPPEKPEPSKEENEG